MNSYAPNAAPNLADDHDLRRLAARRVSARVGLVVHGTVYAVVNALLVAINLQVSPAVAWSLYPLVAWGLGLLGHAVGVSLLLASPRGLGLVDAEVERLRFARLP